MERPTNSSKFKRARKGRGHTSSVSSYLASILSPESSKYNNTKPSECGVPMLLLHPQMLFHTRRTPSQSIGQHKNEDFWWSLRSAKFIVRPRFGVSRHSFLNTFSVLNFNRNKLLCDYLVGQIWSSKNLFFKFSPSLKTAKCDNCEV